MAPGEVFGCDLRVKATEGQSRERQKRGRMLTSSAPCCRDGVASSWPQSSSSGFGAVVTAPSSTACSQIPRVQGAGAALAAPEGPLLTSLPSIILRDMLVAPYPKWGIHTTKTGTLYK